jgi:hypothetical protein
VITLKNTAQGPRDKGFKLVSRDINRTVRATYGCKKIPEDHRKTTVVFLWAMPIPLSFWQEWQRRETERKAFPSFQVTLYRVQIYAKYK